MINGCFERRDKPMGNLAAIEKDFLNLLKEQSGYKEILTLLHWDAHTNIPKNSVDNRAEVSGFLSGKLQQSETSEKMKYYIDTLKDTTENEMIKKVIKECETIYEKNRKIPQKEFEEYVMFCSKSESVWQEAREKSDFTLFQPYLERIVEYNKRFADYWGYETNRYDALLHNHEPGITTKTLDTVFPELRKSLMDLIGRINNSSVKSDSSILVNPFPIKDQEALSVDILQRLGYGSSSGRLDTSVHPYSFAINPNDVRVTTRYNDKDFRIAVFSAIHEAGHALYEQNFAPKFHNTPLAEAASMGIHESQSLFWEIFIGKSKSFWESNYELFKSYAPKHFHQIPFDDFYLALHEVKPSLIRVEADELTYPLHIMIRYELEKALINGDIKVAELPHLWNEKMVDYLGIKPPTDREGILQDIHWSSGDFGYFPSYTLGYMYAAQLNHKLVKELDFNKRIKNNDYNAITEWFTKNVHQYGKTKKPLEMLEDVTKEKLNPNYLVQYLTEKYTEIYQL